MSTTQSQAIKITEETYPIAVACLVGGFAVIPKQRVMGAYLIINKLETQYFKRTGQSPILVLSNFWVSEEAFKAMYKKTGKKNSLGFFDVEQISNRVTRSLRVNG